MVFAFVVACEIAFWLLLLAGLAARYPLRRRRLGAVLLALTPVTDFVLLVAGLIDLRAGATAGFAHGLAALYLGFSVVFGPSVVRWADARFAHRFAGGPPPPPLGHGWERARHEWREFGRALLAAGIAAALLLGAIAWVADPDRTAALTWWLGRLVVVLVIWLLWPVTYTIWPSRPKAGSVDRVDRDTVHPNG